MPKSIPIMLVLAVLLIFGLTGWNFYLINQVDKLKEIETELRLKNQMLEGDNDVLSYDLVTCRDSLRILNND